MVGMLSSNHQCTVPNWNVRQQQQQEQVVEMEGARVGGEERNRSSHVHMNQMIQPNHHHHHHQHHITPPPPSSSMHFQVQEVHLPPAPHQQDMSNYEVAELTWENGQLAMHGLGGLTPTAQEKPTWGRAGDTLESIVHLATCPLPPGNIVSTGASSAGKWAETQTNAAPSTVKKRLRSDPENYGAPNNNNIGMSRRNTALQEERSACASASATFCRENQNDSTMMTWPSFDSSRSLRTKTLDEDSASHGGTENRDEERETKGETGRSSSKRASRAAAVHNQSERRRRDRINQKMKDLQKLVPNASKTDKASMLDEVIDYLKQLQAQVQLMSARNNMPQMMMPLAMQQQQQIQMSLLARMGMGVGLGMGMGMMDMSGMARSSPQSLPPLIHPSATTNAAFMQMMPPVVSTRPQPQSAPSSATPNNPNPFNDPYCAFLAQSMNMELYNKMAALYRQQLSQTIEATTRSSSSGHDQRG